MDRMAYSINAPMVSSAQSPDPSRNHPIPAVISRNRYAEDPALQALLRRHLSPAALAIAEPWFEEMGALAAGPINELAFVADAHPPVLERYDSRGDRADRVVYHPAYRELERLSFGWGIISRFYEPETRARLNLHSSQTKFTLGYLFSQAEQGVYCPVAMTDSAARLLERHGDEALRERYLSRMVTSDLERLYQGAMFLTEREGGSDVGATTTLASCERNSWRLTGEKWFCSNAGADVMMALGRVEQADGRTVAGTRGLGLFLVPKTLEDGSPNHLRIRQLKNKLGTRSMATGEVSLRGAVGYAVGPVDRGFLIMTEMLNMCRFYNAVASLGLTRRVLWEAACYAAERQAFGRAVDSYRLVEDLLCGLFAELEGSVDVLLSAARDLEAAEEDEEARDCFRLMVPLLKLETARLAVRAASEAVELLGGVGYLEDSVTARFYRDAQVLPVWEGTTNILYLDALRAVVKEQAHRAVFERIERLVGPVAGEVGELALEEAEELASGFEGLLRLDSETAPLPAKRLCDRLWSLYMRARLLAPAERNPRLAAVVERLAGKETQDLAGAYRLIVRGASAAA